MKKLLLILTIFTLFSCSKIKNETKADDKLSVLVTIRPYYILLNEIAKDKVELNQFIPDSISVHTYSPTIKDIKLIEDADLIIQNGANLEPNIDKLIKKKKVFDISKHLNIKIDKHHHEDGTHCHEHETNPHFWFSILYMKKIVNELVVFLQENDKTNYKFYEENGKKVLDSISNIDKQIFAERKKIQNISYVAFHDSFYYFNERYNLDALFLQESPGVEPSVKHILDLTEKIKTKNAKIIFFEPQFDSVFAKRLASKLNITAKEIDPLGVSYNNFSDYYSKTWEIIKENY